MEGASTKAPLPGAAGRARRLLSPTLGDLVAVFLIGMVVLAGRSSLFTDGDVATHVATGLWVLEHHEVPATDPFSATAPGRAWFAHEWLAGVGMALVYRANGWAGLVAAAALLIAGIHVLLYRFLVRRGDDALVSFCVVAAAAGTASTHWVARPHLVTVLFLVMLAILLEEVTSGRRPARWLLAVPPLLLVWANVHGGFLVAFGTLACYGAGLLIDARPWGFRRDALPPESARARNLLVPLAAASGGAAIAVLVNPYGWRLPAHLLAFFTVRGEALQATTEFQSPFVNARAGGPFFVFLFIALAGLLCGVLARRPGRGGPKRRGPRLFGAGALLAFAMSTVMAASAVRHVEVMVVFGALVMADGFSALARRLADKETCAFLETLRARELRCGGGLFMLVAALLTLHVARGGLPESGYDPGRFPVAMLQRLKADGVAPKGPVLTPAEWGGYLTLSWPEARPYVDGRWDMRGDAVFERYVAFQLALDGWERGLREDGVQLALLPPGCLLAAKMRDSPEWRLWGADGTTAVFERREAPAPPP